MIKFDKNILLRILVDGYDLTQNTRDFSREMNA